jgi:3-oxoacyl-[acyl-carrier protein] reductase
MSVLITGAASPIGIGRATAIAFARAHEDLILCDVDEANLSDASDACTEIGVRVLTLPMDVSDTVSVRHACAAAIEWAGRIDVLVSNAGIARKQSFESIGDDEWDAVMETNFGGARRCVRELLPGMIERRSGRIISVSSLMGSAWAWGEHVHYSASKAAIEGMTRALAVEVGPHQITANAVAPGFIRTNQSLDVANSAGSQGLDRLRELVPLRRIGTPEEVADLIVFLASAGARYITGQTILVDGGVTLGDTSYIGAF